MANDTNDALLLRYVGESSMNRGGRWFVVIIGLVLISAVFAFATGRRMLAEWSFTKSVDTTAAGQDRGYYYRFKARFAYKGEPLDFDIVVGCNVRITTYKDNDRTVEVGVAPMAYGLKMKDGHGVVVRPPQACNGETAENGKVSKSLLPLIVTYESADEPWLGVAYASEDAYDSPLSELKFLGASISKATHEEWQEWRRAEAPRNFLTYALLGINPMNMWDFPKWKPGYRVMATDCLGASWIKLPEPVRNLVRRFWPSDKPVYWFPNWEMRDALWRAVVDPRDPPLFDGNRFLDYFESSNGANALARRQPGSVISFGRQVAGDVYPAWMYPSINRLGPDGELPAEVKVRSQLNWVEAEVKPELRGFAYCDDTIFKVEGVPSGSHSNPQLLLSKINGAAIGEELRPAIAESDLVFERDDYLILPRRYEIGNIFGGL